MVVSMTSRMLFPLPLFLTPFTRLHTPTHAYTRRRAPLTRSLARLLALSAFGVALSAYLLHHRMRFLKELLGRGVFAQPLQLLGRDDVPYDAGIVALYRQWVTGG
jgi:hypothetical protein